MVLVYMKDGNCIELADALTAAVEDGNLLCFNRGGACIATFDALAVEAYTSNPFWAEEIKEEVCEDFTVVQANDATSQQTP